MISAMVSTPVVAVLDSCGWSAAEPYPTATNSWPIFCSMLICAMSRSARRRCRTLGCWPLSQPRSVGAAAAAVSGASAAVPPTARAPRARRLITLAPRDGRPVACVGSAGVGSAGVGSAGAGSADEGSAEGGGAGGGGGVVMAGCCRRGRRRGLGPRGATGAGHRPGAGAAARGVEGGAAGEGGRGGRRGEGGRGGGRAAEWGQGGRVGVRAAGDAQ